MAVPISICLSALIGAAVAVISVAKHRITVQKQTAIQFVTHIESDNYISDNLRIFKKLIKENKLLSILDDDPDFDNKQAVTLTLNLMETLSVSVLQNVFDENVCKATVGDYVVKRWDDAKVLIDEIRTLEGTDEIYLSFQSIAERWRDNLNLEQERYFPRIWQEIKRL